MKFLPLAFFILAIFYQSSLFSQNVTVSGANASSNGSYATLQAAFTAVNSFNQSGLTITISVVGNTTETGTATLSVNSGPWSTLTVSPGGGSARTISGSIAGSLITLDGADNVTIDGLNSGSNSLTLDNTSTSNVASTVKFMNDATSNTVTRCTIKGSTTGAAGNINDGGVVWFAGTSNTTGNDNNTISYNDIGASGSNLPYNTIRSYATVSKGNDNILIDNNTVHDFFQGNLSGNINANGIYVVTYATAWTITNNKFYQTSTRTYSQGGQSAFRVIRISTNSNVNSGNFNISNNVIGYANSSGTGTTTIDVTGTLSVEFEGIILEAGSSGSSSTISGNTIAGIDLSTARAPSSIGLTNQAFVAIYVDLCPASITNNTIGSSSGTGSIAIHSKQTTAATTPGVVGIISRGTFAHTISGNTIGGITVSKHASASQNTMIFVAIKKEGSGNTTISSNTIGNAVANNITSDQTGAGILGIYSTSSPVTVSGNTIQNLTHTGVNSGTGSSASIIGISNTATTTNGDYLSGNQLITLKNSAVTISAIEIHGIYWNASTAIGGTAVTIEKNRIVDFQTSSTAATSLLAGLTMLGGNYSVYNNMISLGNSGAANPLIRGIYQVGGVVTGYFNSVRISGSANTGSGASAAYYNAAANTLTARNNIFINERSTSSAGSPKHYAIYFAATPSYTGSNNDLYVSGTSGVLGFASGADQASLANWNTATGQDNPSGGSFASVNSAVSFTSVTDLHVTDCVMAGKGTSVTVTSDYDASTRNTTPWIGADEPFSTWNGGTGNWNVASNWTPAVIPSSYNDVIIGSGSVSLDNNATCHSITISAGANFSANIYKLTLGASSCLNSFFVNNGTFNANTGTVQFDGASSTLSGSISGTTATAFSNVILNTGVTFPASPLQATINSSLQLNSGSYVNTNTPIYGNSSTLTYNTNGSYGVGTEWTSTTDGAAGSGRPNHVTIVNSTLNMTTTSRAMAGKLSINLSGSLVLNVTSGDLLIRGDWSDQGTFTPNSRAVFFTGTADQTVTRVGGGTETFSYFCINMPNGGTYVKPDNSAGNLTDISINASAGNVLQLINSGSLDLNGRTVTLNGNNAASSTGYIYVNGARTITNSQGISNGKFEIKSTANPNQPTWFTKSVANNAGTGSLTFDQNVLVTIADGKMDFGYSGTNLTTIQGVLQVNLGGSVSPNSCFYSASPASTLRFANTVDYQVNATDYTWAAGALYSGIAGIPYNVEINTSGTDVTINNTRGVRNNLTITDGTLTLTSGIGNFNVGGNWTRSGATSAFTPNNNRVVFDGNGDQTISCTASSGTETFYELEISNNDPSPQVTQSGTTNLKVTNQLVLTSGILTTSMNEVYIMNSSAAAVAGNQTNPSLAAYYSGSWVNGNLRRNVTAGISYDLPVGTSANYQLASLTFNAIGGITDVLASFTPGSNGTFTGCQVNGTDIIDMLDGGYWTLVPAGSVTGVSYDLTLFETGYSNFSGAANYLGLIKRSNSALPWSGTNYGSDGVHVNGTSLTYPLGAAKVIRTAIPTFSDYAIGFSDDIVLPIELTEFTASAENGNALLQWFTSSEYNSDYFSVERSFNGKDFEEIGKEDAAKYSTQPNEYYFTDYAIAKLGVKNIFYRLRMVDQDESFEYSMVREIDLQSNAFTEDFHVFPNPFHTDIALEVTVPQEQEATLDITDVSGRIIRSFSAQLVPGINYVSLQQLGELTGGVYFIRLHSPYLLYQQEMVKQ